MSEAITIPPVAIEAAAIEMAPHPWSMYTAAAQDHFRGKARAACLAMLRAWPGAEHYVGKDEWNLNGDTWTVRFVDAIILPLTEKQNAEG